MFQGSNSLKLLNNSIKIYPVSPTKHKWDKNCYFEYGYYLVVLLLVKVQNEDCIKEIL